MCHARLYAARRSGWSQAHLAPGVQAQAVALPCRLKERRVLKNLQTSSDWWMDKNFIRMREISSTTLQVRSCPIATSQQVLVQAVSDTV